MCDTNTAEWNRLSTVESVAHKEHMRDADMTAFQQLAFCPHI